MDQLTQLMRNALSRERNVSLKKPIADKNIIFTLDPTNSNRAIGDDNLTIITLEYGESVEDNYIKYAFREGKQYFYFENHHNRSCSIFIHESQKLSKHTVIHLRHALIAIGFTDNIEINLMKG